MEKSMQVHVVSFIPYSKLTDESFRIVFGLNSEGSRYCNRLLPSVLQQTIARFKNIQTSL